MGGSIMLPVWLVALVGVLLIVLAITTIITLTAWYRDAEATEARHRRSHAGLGTRQHADRRIYVDIRDAGEPTRG